MYSENTISPLTIQNRVTQHQLLAELEELRKAEKASLRCMKYESDRLLAKYKHLNPYLTGSQASDVKMYTTHIPGFCFHRNGDYRCSTHRLNKEISRIPYQVLEDIIFTDMEVDIQKIISLHLLSAHFVDTNKSHSTLSTNKNYMSPTWKTKVSQVDSRQQSYETSYTQLIHYSQLPVFVLQPNKERNQSLSEDDFVQELQTTKKAEILINVQINNLISAILDTLAKINPAKFNEIVRISSCPALLNDLIEKPNVQIFLSSLISNPLVSKPEHFYVRLLSARYVCPKSSKTTEAGQYSSTAFLLAIPENCKLLEKLVHQMHNILTKRFYQYGMSRNQSNILLDDLSVISEDVLNETFASFDGGTEPNIFDKFNLKKVLNAQSLPETLISTSSQQNSFPFDKHFLHRFNTSKGWHYMSKVAHGMPKVRRTTEMDQGKLLSSILRRVSNAQRILIGNEIAKIKNRDVNIKGFPRTRASMSDAMANVMSKKSLISLACSSTREQQELIFKPPSKGGLGFGSLIVGDRLGVYVSNYTKFAIDSDILKPYAGGNVNVSESQITIEESDLSFATIAKVKQDVANMETKKRMLKFLKAKIPGEMNTQ